MLRNKGVERIQKNFRKGNEGKILRFIINIDGTQTVEVVRARCRRVSQFVAGTDNIIHCMINLKMEVEVFGYLLLFLVQLGITWFLTKNISFELGIVEFLVKCVIAGIVSMSISILPFIRTDACRYWMTYLTGKFGNIIRKGK